MRQTEQRRVLARGAALCQSCSMATKPSSARSSAVQRAALRDAVAVVLSSAELLHRHIDRMSQTTRDRQLAVLRSAAIEVQFAVDLLVEEGP